MKYENAKDILPLELLKALQEYAAGKLLYVPVEDDKRNWGEVSGYRHKLKKRNQMIRNKYATGVTVSELADSYFLSLDSVKKIVYSKQKEDYVMYTPSLQSAVAYANHGMIEEWALSHILLTHNETNLYDELMAEPHIYFGVVKLPIRLIQMPQDALDTTVTSPIDPAVDTYDTSPLVVTFRDGSFSLPVNEYRLPQLKAHKLNAYPAVVLINGANDHKRFMVNYGRHLIFVD